MDHFLKHLKDVVNNISSQLQPIFAWAKPAISIYRNHKIIKCSLCHTGLLLLTKLLTFTIRESSNTGLSENLLRNTMELEMSNFQTLSQFEDLNAFEEWTFFHFCYYNAVRESLKYENLL